MNQQKKITSEILESYKYKNIKILVEEKIENSNKKDNFYYIGRSDFQSPEIDGNVVIISDNENNKIKEFENIMITRNSDYDLQGVFRKINKE